ncbi:InlB B-repeat-containing protein [Pseudoscardovia radai]|uniref:InlB B-repeat-containing protein n=1 Tax=Pseudoscardovia radai TaxID=987066 RepID=UPI003993F410
MGIMTHGKARHGAPRRLLAGILALATLGATLTAGAVVQSARTTQNANAAVPFWTTNTKRAYISDKLENGTFDNQIGSIALGGHVEPQQGYIGNYNDDASWKAIPNFDWKSFGWDSEQGMDVDPATGRTAEGFWPKDATEHPHYSAVNPKGDILAHAIQIDAEPTSSGAINRYAEIIAEDPKGAIWQDVQTQPGTMYVWSLKHASNNTSHIDGMSVLIGAPGQETAQNAYRQTVNGSGDQPGPVGTVIRTHDASGSPAQDSTNFEPNWETYTGEYIVPAGQTTTRFTFQAVDGYDVDTGNPVDDIAFTKAYRLHYDANGGVLDINQSSQNNVVTNNNDGTPVGGDGLYYAPGVNIQLHSGITGSHEDIDGNNVVQIGWSDTPLDVIKSTDWNNGSGTDPKTGKTYNSEIYQTLRMPDSEKTVYAVYLEIVSSVSLRYDMNLPAGATTNTKTPDMVTVPKGSVAADSSGWTANVNDKTKLTGYVFNYWADKNGTPHDFSQPLTADTTVYASWAAIPVNVWYEANTDKVTGDMYGWWDSTFYSETLTVAGNKFTTSNAVRFTGWNTKADGTGIPFSEGDKVKGSVLYDMGDPVGGFSPGRNLTLYAQWVPVTYTVVYDANNTDATGSMQNQTMTFGQSAALNANQYKELSKYDKPDGTPGKWVFAGWNTKADGTGTSYADKATVKDLTVTPDGTVTLYAQWSRLKGTLRFDKNSKDVSGSVPDVPFDTFDKVTVTDGASKRLSSKDYVFSGWNTKEDGTGDWVKEGQTLETKYSDITLYAQWVEKPVTGGILPMTGGDGTIRVDTPKLILELAAITASATAAIIGLTQWRRRRHDDGLTGDLG